MKCLLKDITHVKNIKTSLFVELKCLKIYG